MTFIAIHCIITKARREIASMTLPIEVYYKTKLNY